MILCARNSPVSVPIETALGTRARKQSPRHRGSELAPANMWIEGQNNPAQWVGWTARKTPGRRRSVFCATPLMEPFGHLDGMVRTIAVNQRTFLGLLELRVLRLGFFQDGN